MFLPYANLLKRAFWGKEPPEFTPTIQEQIVAATTEAVTLLPLLEADAIERFFGIDREPQTYTQIAVDLKLINPGHAAALCREAMRKVRQGPAGYTLRTVLAEAGYLERPRIGESPAYQSSLQDRAAAGEDIPDADLALVPIACLTLSVRAHNALRHDEYYTLLDLKRSSRQELFRTPNLGMISLTEVVQAVAKFGVDIPEYGMDRRVRAQLLARVEAGEHLRDEELAQVNLYDLGLSRRTISGLQPRYDSLLDLKDASKATLRKRPQIGAKSLEEIEAATAKFGVTLQP